MMKLTVAFLGALAAADAAEARRERRSYGYGGDSYPGNSYGDVSSAVVPEASSEVPYVPAESSPAAVPYVQSSAEAFYTSGSPAEATYPSATPSPANEYGNGYGEVPYGGAKSSSVEKPSESTVPIESYTKPAESAAYGGGFSQGYQAPTPSAAYPAGGKPSDVYPSGSKPSGVYPSGAKPSGAHPSGGYGSKPESSPYPVKGASSAAPSGTGYPLYPTGTGSYPGSKKPVSGHVSKTVSEDDCVTSVHPVSEYTSVVTETLVYTVGVGSTAHPVTTEVVNTKTSTAYTTIVITLSKPTPTGASGYPVGGESVYPEGEVPTGTETSTSTSTTTKYVTIHATPSGKGPVGSESYPTGPAGGEGYPAGPSGTGVSGEECAAPVTVTVTAQQTVTVTKGSEQPSTYPGDNKPSGEKPSGGNGKPSSPSGYPTYPGDNKPSGSYPEASATPSAKYPVGNGTYPGYPAGPTGFKTHTKPAYPEGTKPAYPEVPSKPSETASLPYFSFVSEVPYPTGTPSKEAEYPASTPAAAESSAAYPVGGDYGYGSPSSAVETPYAAETPSPSPAAYEAPSKTPEEQTYPTPTPASDNSYGSGYGTY